MSTRRELGPEMIRVRSALIRSRWDADTAAERRAAALARQRELAQKLGIGLELTEGSDVVLQSCVAGAA